MKLTLEHTDRSIELHEDGNFVAEVLTEVEGKQIVGLIDSAHELAAAIKNYFWVLDEAKGKDWRKTPDAVQEKMLKAHYLYLSFKLG